MASAPYDPNDPNAPSPAAPRRPGAFEQSYQDVPNGASGESRRIFLIAAIILALAAVGLIFWLTGERAGRTADGIEVPVIEAPEGAYKTRPADPGGEMVPHQDKEIYDRAAGNMRPRVEHLLPLPEEPVKRDAQTAPAEEKDREAMAALVEAAADEDEKAAPAPEPKSEPTPVAKAEPVAPKPAPKKPAPAASSKPVAKAEPVDLSTPVGENDWLVQVAALGSQKIAENAWASFQKKHADLSRDLKPFYKHVEISGKGSFVRLRVGPFADREAATVYCGALKARKQDCLTIRPGR